MTAPGNTALVVSLMAVFVACAAYAIGRLHQRGRDREDAYREGYDNATRSTFSVAARAVARRRAARATADGPTAGGPSAGGPSADRPSAGGPSADRPSAGGPSADRPSAGGPSADRPSAGGPTADGLRTDGPGVEVSAFGGRVGDGLGAAGLGPAEPEPASVVPFPAEHNPTPLGFPVPPPAPPQIIGEPAAFGGVVYRPFPDPRLVGNSEPLPADRGSLHGVSSPRPSSSRPASPGPAGSVAASAEGEAASSGRHTVPDELVRSATYRLPADRVFRAKVPEPADRPALPDEPTTKLSVPKPRQS